MLIRNSFCAWTEGKHIDATLLVPCWQIELLKGCVSAWLSSIQTPHIRFASEFLIHVWLPKKKKRKEKVEKRKKSTKKLAGGMKERSLILAGQTSAWNSLFTDEESFLWSFRNFHTTSFYCSFLCNFTENVNMEIFFFFFRKFLKFLSKNYKNYDRLERE